MNLFLFPWELHGPGPVPGGALRGPIPVPGGGCVDLFLLSVQLKQLNKRAL